MPDLTTVYGLGGAPFTVAKDYSQQFQDFLNDPDWGDYKAIPDQSGGYNPRKIAGTDTWSNHALGAAIDVNWNNNQRGTAGEIDPDIARAIAQKHGMVWGGDWKNPDPMHFEIAGLSPSSASALGGPAPTLSSTLARGSASMPYDQTGQWIPPEAYNLDLRRAQDVMDLGPAHGPAGALASLLGGALGGTYQNRAQKAIVDNSALAQSTFANAANAPDQNTLARALIASGVPGAQQQGMSIFANNLDPMHQLDLRQKTLAVQEAEQQAKVRQGMRDELGLPTNTSISTNVPQPQAQPSQASSLQSQSVPAAIGPSQPPQPTGGQTPGAATPQNPRAAALQDQLIQGAKDVQAAAPAISKVVQGPNGPVAVDANNKPLLNIPQEMRRIQWMNALGTKESIAEAEAHTKLITGILQSGIMPTVGGGVTSIPGFDRAAASKKAAEETGSLDAKYSDSIYKGMAGSGMIGAQQKQNIALIKDVLADPAFVSGTAADAQLGIQRAMATFAQRFPSLGIDPNRAASREVFNQTMSRILGDQFSGLKTMASETGESGARIFKPMLDMEVNALPNEHDSIEGIRRKIDILDKAGDLMIKWADKAADYKTSNPSGRLDPQFEKDIRADIAKARLPTGGPLDEARSAIAKGAPKDKVIARLKASGINPEGLEGF